MESDVKPREPMNEDEHVQTQKDDVNSEIKYLIRKSKESALLAVEIHNKPLITFRIENFTTLLTIAWNALLQAILRKNGKEVFARNPDGSYKTIDNDKMVMDTRSLMSEYFNADDPIRANLEIIIELRNKVEHRASIDDDKLDYVLFDYLQACILNYQDVLTREFPDDSSLGINFSLAIQFSNKIVGSQAKAITDSMSYEGRKVVEFIQSHSINFGDTIVNTDKFRFRLFLVSDVANNPHRDDIPIRFVKINEKEVKTEVGPYVIGVREKVKVELVEVASQKIYRFLPKEVARRVKKVSGCYFTLYSHFLAWRRYGLRPIELKEHQCECCIYDPIHFQYIYSQKWIDFLIDKLKDPKERIALRC